MRRFSAFFFLFTILLAIPVSAAEPYPSWSTDEMRGYYNGYNMAALPDYFTVYDINSDSTLIYSDDGFIDRTINGVQYSAFTRVFRPDPSVGFSGMNFVIPFSYFFDGFTNTFVSDFDIIFLVNIYGTVSSGISSTSVPQVLARSLISDVLYSDDSVSDPFGLLLNVELVDSVRYSQASCTYIYRVSYHSDTFYFDTRSYGETKLTFELSVPGFTTSEIYSNIIDIDLGVVGSRVGRSIVSIPWEDYQKPLDIWAGIGKLPPVQFPAFDDSSVSTTVPDLFASVSSLDIVTVLIIPIGVLAIGFFTFRMLLWK